MRGLWAFAMRLWAGVEVALGGVATGGLRSILTVLGVAIGVASVMSLLAVGQGARLAVAAQYQSLGTDVITIESHSALVQLTDRTAAQLLARVPFVGAVMPVVGVSAPVYWRTADQGGSTPTVLGVTPALLRIRDERLAAGAFISPLEQTDALHVAVLGHDAAQQLFGGLDPVGQQILVGATPFRVIGVLAFQGGAPIGGGAVPVLAGTAGGSSTAASGTSGSGAGSGGGSGSSAGAGGGGTAGSGGGQGSGQGSSAQQTLAVGSGIDGAVLIPESTAELLVGTAQVSAIWMKAKSRQDVEPALLQTQRILALLFHLDPAGQVQGGSELTGPGGPGVFSPGKVGPVPGPFIGPVACAGPGCGGSPAGAGQLVVPGAGAQAVSVESLDDLVQQADAANRVLSLMLTAIAGVSLLVGGIGVMNIMLVSVRERTVEIGLRKALGALQLDLLYQFVVEALLLCGLGGIGGWAAGFGGVRLLQHYGVQATPLPGALGVALAAAAGVGVLFGTYPAYLASELEPVEALRRQ